MILRTSIGDPTGNRFRPVGGHDEPQLACPSNADAPNGVKMCNSAVAVLGFGCVYGGVAGSGPVPRAGRREGRKPVRARATAKRHTVADDAGHELPC
ncbi:hypothetical protein CA54_41670 [Symmachiella macrocystis]|uniref:Uncharacterized protein n=1 Tax=Symmachiella macrocystis TaxID=2527985 RepID=A0A5C6BAC7_9PLAN|nr:hypothetical protein CA54_41670 [Symmachiella macrocystis]